MKLHECVAHSCYYLTSFSGLGMVCSTLLICLVPCLSMLVCNRVYMVSIKKDLSAPCNKLEMLHAIIAYRN